MRLYEGNAMKKIIVLMTVVSVIFLLTLTACDVNGKSGRQSTSSGSVSSGQQSGMFTVTFDVCGGSEVPVQSVKEGEKALRPSDPSREGNEFIQYIFSGWYLGESLYDFGSAVRGNITLTARWEEIIWSEDIGNRD